MRLSLSKYFLILITQLYPLINSKDADCVLKPSITVESDCVNVKTGTEDICCFYSDGTESCITADGSTPQTILTSIVSIKSLIPPSATKRIVECNTKAEICSKIQLPTSFLDCNKTELPFPFSCCFLETSTVKQCYPVNARYNTTVAYDAELLKTQFQYTEVPKITCSTKALPYPISGISLKINYISLLFVMLIYLFL